MNNFQKSIQALLSSIKIKNNIVYLNDKTVNNSDDLTIDLVSRLQSVIYEFYTRRKDATPLNENTLWREKRWQESFVSAETQYFSTWRTTNSKLTSCISLSGVCQAENGIERIVENSTRYIFLGQDKETQQFVVRVAQERFLIGNAKKEDDNTAYNWIFGEKTFPSQNSLPTTLRFYFNLIPNQVRIESFIYDLKYLFDTWEIPFAFKFLGIYKEYQRADSAVLYVSQKYFYLILWLIQILHNKYYPINAFNDEIPHFTYPVFKGVGFAENPEVDEEISFGTFRSRKLANIIITLTKNGSQELPTIEVFLEAIKSDISFDRFIIEKIYLNYDSNFHYDFKYWLRNQPKGKYLFVRNELPIFLKQAVIIARKICKEAMWLFDKENVYCTWISVKKNDIGLARDSTNIVFQPIDNSFDTGGLGILLFLKLMASMEEVSMIDRIYFREIAENLQNKIAKEKQIINGTGVWEELLASLQNQDETTEEVTHNLFRIMLNLISDKEIKEGFSDKIKEIFNDFFERDKPIPNNVVENEGQYYFCPNLTQGLACIGYFFARFYDPNKFKSIPKSLLFPLTEESQ